MLRASASASSVCSGSCSSTVSARGKRRLRVTTTDSRHGLPIAPNLLNRNFAVTAPNRAWTGNPRGMAVSGRGYRPVQPPDGGPVDATGDAQQSGHRCTEMAWLRCSPDRAAGHIFHSDRGSQYASHEFSGLLLECGITASMSRKGDCWNNAPTETLFASRLMWVRSGQPFPCFTERRSR
jgi:putative transposase